MQLVLLAHRVFVALRFRVIMFSESRPARIIIPQSTLYGWNPLSFEPANEIIKTAYHSGQIHHHLMNAIAFSCRGHSKEDCEKMQNRCSVLKLDRFASSWIAGGDFDSVLGLAIAIVPLFLCDDVRDKKKLKTKQLIR